MAERRILVVDDEALVLDAVRLTLTHFGHVVETASSGAEALVKLEQAVYHIVVTDLKMPNMTGDQLAGEIKRRCPGMPVLLLTGYPPPRTPKDVDLVLLKPFSTADLRGAVEFLTARPGASPATPG